MTRVWKLLKYLPPNVRAILYVLTTSEFRLRVRDRFGGSHRSIPDRVVTLADGRRIHIGPDYIYWPIHAGAQFEPAATSIVRRLVRPGDYVVDVGANFGWYTTLLAQIVGDLGHVLAFEPMPPTFERLAEHLKLNSCGQRVTAMCSAVGAQSGRAEIHLFDRLSHSRSSLAALGQRDFTKFDVAVTALDSLRERGVKRIDFVKCDVEGSELDVLRGARGWLHSDDAPIVLVELNAQTSAAFGYQPLDIWSELRSQGYDRFYRIGGKGWICPIRRPDELRRVNLLLAGKGCRILERLQHCDDVLRGAA